MTDLLFAVQMELLMLHIMQMYCADMLCKALFSSDDPMAVPHS